MKKILLNKGFKALVDDEDYQRLKQYTWFVIGKDRCFYAIRSIYNKGDYYSSMMHREILGLTDPKVSIDHKDCNGLNNQRSNLRISTSKQNAWNRRKRIDSRNKYKGVNSTLYGKFRAIINIDGTNKHIGTYDNEKEAALAYNVAASFSRGKFAYLNKI